MESTSPTSTVTTPGGEKKKDKVKLYKELAADYILGLKTYRKLCEQTCRLAPGQKLEWFTRTGETYLIDKETADRFFNVLKHRLESLPDKIKAISKPRRVSPAVKKGIGPVYYREEFVDFWKIADIGNLITITDDKFEKTNKKLNEALFFVDKNTDLYGIYVPNGFRQLFTIHMYYSGIFRTHVISDQMRNNLLKTLTDAILLDVLNAFDEEVKPVKGEKFTAINVIVYLSSYVDNINDLVKIVTTQNFNLIDRSKYSPAEIEDLNNLISYIETNNIDLNALYNQTKDDVEKIFLLRQAITNPKILLGTEVTIKNRRIFNPNFFTQSYVMKILSAATEPKAEQNLLKGDNLKLLNEKVYEEYRNNKKFLEILEFEQIPEQITVDNAIMDIIVNVINKAVRIANEYREKVEFREEIKQMKKESTKRRKEAKKSPKK